MASQLDLTVMVSSFLGGLSLFLYGLHKMTEALKTVAGVGLKKILSTLTTNRFTGALSGALVTSIIQSSSVTTVLVVGFVSAGLMTFTQSIGVIMGANVGTTVTAQIIALDITEYSLLMIFIGFFVELMAKRARVQYYGVALMGLGLLFFGMELIGNAVAPLREYSPFISFMKDFQNVYVGILAGLVFTAIVQSSSATTGIVIVLGSQGLISLESGIAIILGANVGTCITAALSAIGKSRDAVKVVAIHILFNLIGVLLLVGFIGPFADLVRHVSPSSPDLSGTARLAAEVPRQIANAHTIFNVSATLVLLGFAGSLRTLIERVVPSREKSHHDPARPSFLDDAFLDQPSVALELVRSELVLLNSHVLEMLNKALPAALHGQGAELDSIAAQDAHVDELHGLTVNYLGRLSTHSLIDQLAVRVQEYLAVANYLENLGDEVESFMVRLGYRRLDAGLELRRDTTESLQDLGDHAMKIVEQATAAFETRDLELANQVADSNEHFDEIVNSARIRFTGLVTARDRNGLAEYRFCIEYCDGIKRLQTLARRISSALLVAHHSQSQDTNTTHTRETEPDSP